MPRRSQGDEVPAAKTPRTKPAKSDQPTPDPVDTTPKELGFTETRTGAKALNIETPDGGIRTFTAGGDKGAAVAELLQTRDDLTRKQIAELVGCSQSRVAEVARVLGITRPRKTKDEKEKVEAA